MFAHRYFPAYYFAARYFPPAVSAPPVVTVTTGGVNYNQARRAWILREDEELVILNGRLSQP
jgi:hypothetical protein